MCAETSVTFPRFVVLTLKLKKRLQVGQPGGLQPGGFHPVSDETPAAAIPAGGVARKTYWICDASAEDCNSGAALESACTVCVPDGRERR